MKHAQKMPTNLGKADSIITFALAIYTKAKQIQMKFPEEFSGTVIRLGGFHIALNFLSCSLERSFAVLDWKTLLSLVYMQRGQPQR